jgi:CubicO group peptidase (beta-lactamase class C family)
MQSLASLILGGCWLLTASCGEASAPAIPEDVRASARARVDCGYNAGIVVGMVDPGGETFFGYGRTELPRGPKPNDRTVFEIGSVGKVFTALLLAEMAKRGELDLDDPIERHLPDSVAAPRRAGRSITLAHLASHTSGLPNLPDSFNPPDQEHPFAGFDCEDMYAFLRSHRLRRDVGAVYEYSIIGTGLLGHLLSLRARKPFEMLLEERIAAVLGMPDTRFTMTPGMRVRLAQGYSGPIPVGTWPPQPPLMGTGNELSTARDLLTFLAANLHLVETALRPAIEEIQKPRHDCGSPTTKVGLGWHIKIDGAHPIVLHSGGTGGYSAFAGFVSETRTGVVVLSNSTTDIADIGIHLLDPSIPLREIHPPFPVPKEVLRSYEGTYGAAPPFAPGFQQNTEIHVEEMEGWLIVHITGLARVPLHAVSETRFLSPETGGTITFLRNDQGDVTGLVGERAGLRQAARRIDN